MPQSRPTAEIIAIGDELVSGQRLDTNSQWISRRLGDLGVPVRFHTVVGDDLEALTQVFRSAIDRTDIVIASGGLGPTADDLTREAVAQATGTQLIQNEDVFKHIEGLFRRRDRVMPQRNSVQAMFPEGSTPIANQHGTAPGIAMLIPRQERTSCRLFVLPGVPVELFEMWSGTVATEITKGQLRQRVIVHRQIKCFGVGESDLESRLPDLIRRGRHPTVGITVHRATITLRITAEGISEEACFRVMEPTISIIHDCLGPLVFGEKEEELQHAVVRLLKERGATLATAELGTGGLIAEWLSSVPDYRKCFKGGWVMSAEASWSKVLGIEEPLMDQSGPSVVEKMAHASRVRLGADYGLALVQIVEPTDDRLPSPTFWVAWASATQGASHILTSPAHPSFARTFRAKHALNLLRLALLQNDH